MRREIITLCMALLTVCGYAQKERNVIYGCVVKDITYTEPSKQKQTTGQTIGTVAGAVLSALGGTSNVTKNHPEYADNVRNAIIGAVGSCRRIDIVNGDAASGNDVLVLSGTISAITTTERTHTWTDNDKKTHSELQYGGSITGNITLADAATGNIVSNITLSNSGSDYGWLSTADAALAEAVARLKNRVIYSLNKQFPLYASIVEGSTAKKDKQKEVYIDLGEPDGVCKGMSFFVYQVTTVAGKEAKKEIGRLKITEVMGDDISLCKVTRGGKDVKAALDEGATLQIMLRE